MIDAKDFAINKHKEHGNSKHFEEHLNKVFKLVKQRRYSLPKYIGDLQPQEHFPFHLKMKQAAYLHDLLTHTDTTFEEIEEAFGTSVATIVSHLTYENKFNDYNKNLCHNLERYKKLRFEIFEEWAALALKPVDRLVNWRDAIENNDKETSDRYLKEYPIFRESVYYAGTYKPAWDQLDSLYEREMEK